MLSTYRYTADLNIPNEIEIVELWIYKIAHYCTMMVCLFMY